MTIQNLKETAIHVCLKSFPTGTEPLSEGHTDGSDAKLSKVALYPSESQKPYVGDNEKQTTLFQGMNNTWTSALCGPEPPCSAGCICMGPNFLEWDHLLKDPLSQISGLPRKLVMSGL